MARQPVTIEESAARRDLPSARFSPDSASAGAFGGAIARGVQQVGAAVGEFADVQGKLELARLQDQRQREEFAREADFMTRAAAESDRLATESREIKGDGSGFTEDFLGRTDQNFTDFLESVPEARREQWAARYQTFRGRMGGDVLRSEFAIRDAHYGTTLDSLTDQALTRISNAPDDFDGARADLVAAIDASGLPEDEKEKRKLRAAQATSFAYGAALVERDPAAAISALGGTVTQAGDFRLDGGRNPNEQAATTFFRDQGLNTYAVAGLVGTLSWEGAGMNPNARNKGDGAAGDDSIGIGQWNGPRAAALKAFAKSRGTQWNDLNTQLAFVMQEMRTSEPEAYRRLQRATSIEDAVEAMAYYERPQGWRNGGDRTQIIHWNKRVERATAIAGTRATATDETAPPAGSDPRLADLRFEDRMRLMDAAHRRQEQDTREAAAAAAAAQADKINALELAIHDGTAGQADIDAARADGTLTDAGDIARAEAQLAQRNQQNADLTRFVGQTGLGTNYEWNPYSEDDRKAAEAGVLAQGNTPQAGFRVWEQTGILARPAADALRGGLVSQDPARVQASASIAARMLARNPAAFAGVTNGREIEAAAALYLNRIELGDNPEEAARRVAQSNDPVQRARVKANEAEVTAFRSRIGKEDPIPRILNEINGGYAGAMVRTMSFGQQASAPVSASERGALRADYTELAADHFAQYGDAKAAELFARNQIRKMWGPSHNLVGGNRVMRYPPEHVYPAVNGSHNWLYAQAAADIKAERGDVVAPDRLQFIPIPGLTGDAWRQGKPAPYSVQYIDANGQMQTLNRRAFVGAPPASVARASAAETARRAQDFETRRQRSITADDGRDEQIRNPTGPLGPVPGIMTPGT